MSSVPSHKRNQLFKSLEQLTVHFVKERFKVLFEQADDTFFDLAERATNNHQQSKYFDTMRLFRVEKVKLLQFVLKDIIDGFESLSQGKSFTRHSGVGRSQELASLELLDNEELEEMIALDNMASTAYENNKKAIDCLVERIGALAGITVSGKNCPIAPDFIAESASSSLSLIAVDLEIRLIFLKLVDRAVFSDNYRLVVNSQNKLLIESDILPDLEQKKPVGKSSTATAPPKTKVEDSLQRQERSNSDEGVAAGMEGGVSTMQTQQPSRQPSQDRTYSPRRSELLSRLTRSNFSPYYQAKSSSAGTMYEAEQLIDTLEQIVEQSFASDEKRLSDKIQRYFDSSPENKGSYLAPEEEGAVNLIDGLYDTMEKSRFFVDNVESIFNELRLPLLRLALKDPSFFDKHNHPARRLLNEMARIGMSLSGREEDKNSAIYKAMISAVETLRDKGLSDKKVTSTLMSFMNTVEKERKISGVIEQRIMEEVAARERINWAKTQVESALDKRIKGKSLPLLFKEFAELAWSKVLFMAHLREGESSILWRESLNIFDRLLKIHYQPKSLRKPAVVKSTLTQVAEKLQQVSLDTEEQQQFIDAFEQHFLQGTVDYVPNATEGVAVEMLKEALIQSLDTSVPGLNIGNDIDQEEELDAELIGQLSSLRKGAWVEFPDTVQEAMRAKLAGVVGPSWKYVFVNHRGNKVAEAQRSKLAVDILDGKLTVLENSHLFDKALISAVEDLKKRRLSGS